MSGSVWQNVECVACGAVILSDTTKPLTREPGDHEDDCTEADTWPTEGES